MSVSTPPKPLNVEEPAGTVKVSGPLVPFAILEPSRLAYAHKEGPLRAALTKPQWVVALPCHLTEKTRRQPTGRKPERETFPVSGRRFAPADAGVQNRVKKSLRRSRYVVARDRRHFAV